MRKVLFAITCLMLGMTIAAGQEPERRGMNLPPGESVVGKVSAVSKDSLTVTPLMGGEPVTVKIIDTTRVMKDRQPFKVEDIKTEEMVFVRGELKDNVMQARLISVINPEMMQRIGPGGAGGGGRVPGGLNPEDLGKKFIAGEVKAIHETRITVARPDGKSQDIEVDENTSFRKGQESITLPDIKT